MSVGDEMREDVKSTIRCLNNFGGNMPQVRYYEAADLMTGLLDDNDRLQAELDRLRKVLLAEWEKDRKTYAALMEKLK